MSKQYRMSSVDTLLKLALQGEAGRDWYAQANAEVKEAAAELGLSPVRVANVVAVLSPRLRVNENGKLAVEYLRDGTISSRGILPSTETALRHYESTREIRGFKTSAFARNLAGDYSAVALDSHMAKAFRCPQRSFSYRRGYAKATLRVEKVASKLSWHPAEAQAAIWYAVNPRPQAFELVKFL